METKSKNGRKFISSRTERYYVQLYTDTHYTDWHSQHCIQSDFLVVSDLHFLGV